MLQFFPTNYVWNLSVNIALMMGLPAGDIEKICRPLVGPSKKGDDEGTQAFFESWISAAENIVSFAEIDEAAGHNLTASRKYRRASICFLIAERMQQQVSDSRVGAYDNGLAAFRQSVLLGNENCEFVEVPFDSGSYPGLLVRAVGIHDRAPCMVFCNGLDSLKEMGYCSDIANDLSNRGVSVLFIDQPGTGTAIRKRNLYGCYDSERWASPALEYLIERDDVDPNRVGIMGWSLGGYFAPRAAAFEPRFSICASWSANYDWGGLQKKRLNREGDRPVPHYWDHVQWVFQQPDLESFIEWSEQMSLKGVMDRIRVPYLVTHGDTDTQIPLENASRQHRGAVNSPKAELKIFAAEEGGSAHVSADNPGIGSSYIADWVHDNI